MIEGRCDHGSLLRVWVVLVLLFLFVPIAIICLYAFNKSNVQSWPIAGLSTNGSRSRGTTRQVRAALCSR